jgi:hypothetical protein
MKLNQPPINYQGILHGSIPSHLISSHLSESSHVQTASQHSPIAQYNANGQAGSTDSAGHPPARRRRGHCRASFRQATQSAGAQAAQGEGEAQAHEGEVPPP